MTVSEPARSLPVIGEYDVVVIGGGPAGMAAAVSAAKLGAQTLLVERYGFLGGMGTVGGVTNFAGLYGRVNGEMQQVVHGVVDDLLARIEHMGGLNSPQDGMQGRIRVRAYDSSVYKCAADDWLLSAGVRLLFHAHAAAVLQSERRITALIVETKSGRQAIRGRAFIDCSGDADVANFAKVPFELGDGMGSGLYPSTMFRVGHVDAAQALAAVGDFAAINALMLAASERYDFPRKGAILRPQKNPTQWRANVTQISNQSGQAMDATDAWQLSDGEVTGRRQVQAYLQFLRQEVPGFAKAELLEIAPQVGIRESRRILGQYQLSGEDILSSATFDDVIGINAWPMEQHVAGDIAWTFARDTLRPYNQLPYRMLCPTTVDNLWVAGRCASMTHDGQSAARVSGACFVMGQAAGTSAATQADNHLVSIAQLQKQLTKDGACLVPT